MMMTTTMTLSMVLQDTMRITNKAIVTIAAIHTMTELSEWMNTEMPRPRSHPAFLDNLVASDTVLTDSTFRYTEKGRRHDGRGRPLPKDKPFVVWDGEGGTNPKGKMWAQNYILLGVYDGVKHTPIMDSSLSTKRCLEFIVQMGERYPNAAHVSFAFNYDVNMILKKMPERLFRILREKTRVIYDGYRIEHIPDKWLSVTPLTKGTNKSTGRSIRIQDAWGYFQSSLLVALKANIPDHPLMARLAIVEDGKAKRGLFTWSDIEEVKAYWEIENELFYALMVDLKGKLFDPRVNIKVADWYGPGVLANYKYTHENVKEHKADCGPEIYDASRYAYAGGRFELFNVGRMENVYGIDINSAYPYAISHLPSLASGHWEHITYPDDKWILSVKELPIFGLYRLSLRMGNSQEASPLFHRDTHGQISFPTSTTGWYWGPEARQALLFTKEQPSALWIHEAWIFVEDDPSIRPFSFVPELYTERQRLKAAGEGAQMALKLTLNSLYGKMAQRAGWQRAKGAPKWHQLEWAGFVTSYVRAQIFSTIRRVPYGDLLAVETDGIFMRANPATLGITNSKELGAWEVTEYDQIVYLQNGVYAKQQGGHWDMKHRGLDKGTFTPQDIVDFSKRLLPNEDWPFIEGVNTRFIGYAAAMQMATIDEGNMRWHHCIWRTSAARMSIDGVGKRQHSHGWDCPACKNGLTAYEEPHRMGIHSQAMREDEYRNPQSQRHDIPWLDCDLEEDWERYEQEERSLISPNE